MNLRYPCTYVLLLALALVAPAHAQMFGLPGQPCEAGFVDCDLDAPYVDLDLDPDFAPDPDPDYDYDLDPDFSPRYDPDYDSDGGPDYDTLEECIADGDCAPLTPEEKACAKSPTCGLPEEALRWDEDLQAYQVPDLKLYFDPETNQWFEPGGRFLSQKEAKEAAGKVKDRSRIRRLLASTAGGPVGLMIGAIRALF